MPVLSRVRLLVTAAGLAAAALPAAADEVWSTAFGQAIYDSEVNGTAVLTVPENGATLRLYLPGLGGNFQNRSMHEGYWIAPGPGSCPAELVAEDGERAGRWGAAILVFDRAAFPTGWTLLLGECFDAPARSIRAETPLKP